MDLLQILLVLPPLLSAQSTSTFQDNVTADPMGLTSTNTRKVSTSTSGSRIPGPSSKPAAEEERAHVEAYLYSGNTSLLSLVKCTQAYRLSGLQGSQAVLGPFLHQALNALTNAANFLNMIFQANDLRESSIREDMEWYHALVRGLMEGDPLIHRALFTFDTEPAALQPQLVLQASRPSYKSQDILLQDMTSVWERLHPPALAPHVSWYTAFKFSAQLAPTLSKRVLLNDLHTLDTPKWGRGDSYVTSQNGVRWADPPFLECDNGHFLPGWLLTLSTPFYGLKPDLSPEFRGVIRIDVNLQSFDVDQCAKGNHWFFNTHQCNRSSMHCEHIPGRGFRLGQYHCRCKEGFYSPLPAAPDAPVQEKSHVNGSGSSPPALPLCLPCWPGCKQCKDGAPCKVQEDWYLRAAVLTVQGFFMLLVFISMLVAYQFRGNKRIRASGLLLLETILFGSLLLYFPVFILYFKPSTFRCILLRWVRLLGFAIVYGTVTLKMYRVLKVFLSRTAHRVPYMSSTRLLKLLGVVVLTVCWFLTAWTAGALQNRDRSIPLVVSASTGQGQGFTQCDLDRWDYMMAIAEMLFLCWGSSLCSAVKMVPSAFHEPRYMSIAIHNELLLSSLFHVLRFFKPFLHPDWMLLFFFMHTHITVTVTLALLFIPKFLHVSRPLREEIAAEVYEDEVDLRRSCSYFTSSFASAWTEHNLEPDDIRDELKKLYTQLEVHKTKKMTDNNPHLPKKRSSRLGLGQSIIKRITKIPESMSRQCSREEKDVSLCGRTGSKQSSCIKRGLESASIKSSEESFNQCALLLHKSHSTYDYSKDRQSHFVDPRDVSLLDSLMRRKLAKKAFERSEIKSVDAVPFVYKSASAHNLSADQQLLQPEPKKLQKSLSVMTSNKEGSHEQAGKSCNVEQTLDVSRAIKQDSQSRVGASISSQTLNALQSESFDKAEVCPWELEDHLPEGKSQKHVTYATGSCRSQRTLERTDSPAIQQLHLGPWDSLTTDYSVESTVRVREEGIGNDKNTTEDRHGGIEASDSDSESIRPQVPLSSSAPHSPVTGVGKQKEQRVFSFYGRPGLSMKGFMRSGKGSRTDKNKKGLQVTDKNKETMCENIGFHPDTIRISYPRMESVEPLLNDGIKDDLVLQTQKTSITDTLHRQCKETKRTKRKASLQIDMGLPEKNTLENKTRNTDSVYENILTWETLNLENLRKQNSLRTNICPWEMEQEKNVPFTASQDITKVQKPSIANISKHQSMFSQKIINTEVCPWDISQASDQLLTGYQDNFADICPWEVADTSSSSTVLNSDKFPEEMKETGMTQGKEALPANICPSQEQNIVRHRGEDRSSFTNEVRCKSQNQDGLKKEDPNKTAYSTIKAVDETMMKAEVCPWDAVSAYIPQTNERSIEDICPWDVKIPEKERKAQEGALGEICPWETAEPERPFGQSEICPWENEQSEVTDSKKMDEFKCTNSMHRMENEIPNIQSFMAEVCPWDIVVSPQEKTQRMPSIIAEVCPWDMTQSDSPHVQPEAMESSREGLKVMESTAEKQKNSMLNNKETDEGNKMTKMQDVSAVSGQSCPLELETCQAEDKSERERNRGSLISMGEPPNDSTVTRQTSITVEPCPWRFPEMSANINEICPWISMSAKPSLVKQIAIQLSSEEPEATDAKQETTTFVSNCSVTANTVSPNVQTAEKQDKTEGQSGVGQSVIPLTTKESEGMTVRHAGTDANEHSLERAEVTSSGQLPLGDGAQSSAVEVPVLEMATAKTKSGEGPHEAGEAQPEQSAAYCDSFSPWHDQEVKRALVFSNSTPWEGEETTNDAESEAEAFYFPPEL